jgi:hypothetical protein
MKPTAEELGRAPRLKLKRAKQHITDLSGQVDAFLAQNPFKLITVFEPAKNRVALRTKAKIPIPQEFSLIAGDAIHNLRSALDLLMYSFAKDRSPRIDKIAFPFPKTAQGLKDTIANAQVQFAGKKVVEAVTALKPYPNGNKILSGIHELDIRDKHRLLFLTRRVPKITADILGEGGLPFFGPGVLIFQTPEDQDLLVVNDAWGSMAARMRAIIQHKGTWEEEAKFQPTLDITFAEGLPTFDVGPLVATLRVCADAVDEAITLLIEAFLHKDN